MASAAHSVFANKSLNFFSSRPAIKFRACGFVCQSVYGTYYAYERQQHNSLEKCFRNLFLLRLLEFTRAPPDFNTLMTSASTPLFRLSEIGKKGSFVTVAVCRVDI